MAVVKISRKPGSRSGSTNARRESTYTQVYTVVFDSPQYGPIAAADAVAEAYGIRIGTVYQLGNAPDEPDEGDPGDPWHEKDIASRVQEINAQEDSQNSDGRGWHVTVTFGPGEAIEENPLLQPAEIEWSSSAYERPVDQDIEGDPILNTAGDPFDPAPTRDDSRPVLIVTQNELTFSPSLTWEYRDATNNAVFFGAPIGTVKLKSRTGRRVPSRLVPGGYYWVVTYTFEFNDLGWEKRILNAGYREKVGGNLRVIWVDNQPTQTPMLLNASGAKTTTPYFRTFTVYPPKNFGVFAIPGS